MFPGTNQDRRQRAANADVRHERQVLHQTHGLTLRGLGRTDEAPVGVVQLSGLSLRRKRERRGGREGGEREKRERGREGGRRESSMDRAREIERRRVRVRTRGRRERGREHAQKRTTQNKNPRTSLMKGGGDNNNNIINREAGDTEIHAMVVGGCYCARILCRLMIHDKKKKHRSGRWFEVFYTLYTRHPREPTNSAPTRIHAPSGPWTRPNNNDRSTSLL